MFSLVPPPQLTGLLLERRLGQRQVQLLLLLGQRVQLALAVQHPLAPHLGVPLDPVELLLHFRVQLLDHLLGLPFQVRQLLLQLPGQVFLEFPFLEQLLNDGGQLGVGLALLFKLQPQLAEVVVGGGALDEQVVVCQLTLQLLDLVGLLLCPVNSLFAVGFFKTG